jgi:hypothetical protein
VASSAQDKFATLVLLRVYIGELAPRDVILHVPPDQLEGALSLVQQLDTEMARLAAFWKQVSHTEETPVMPI